MFGIGKKRKEELTVRVTVHPYVVQKPKTFFKRLKKAVKLSSQDLENIKDGLKRVDKFRMWVTESEFENLCNDTFNNSVAVVMVWHMDSGSPGRSREIRIT